MPRKMEAESFVPGTGWIRHDELGAEPLDLAAAIEFADHHGDSEQPDHDGFWMMVKRW
jgi:hypothetical protein